MADLGQNIVAPAPDAGSVTSDRNIRAPQAAVIEPAPNVEPTSARKYGDINIAHAEVVAPATQLSLSEPQAGSGRMKRSLGASERIRQALGVLVLVGVSAIALGLDTRVLSKLSIMVSAR